MTMNLVCSRGKNCGHFSHLLQSSSPQAPCLPSPVAKGVLIPRRGLQTAAMIKLVFSCLEFEPGPALLHPALPPCLAALLDGRLSRCHITPGLPFQALLWLPAKQPRSLSADNLSCKVVPRLHRVTMGASLSLSLGLTSYKIGMLT